MVWIALFLICSVFAGGESDLTALQGLSSSDKELALLLIKAMICTDPSDRPSASVICNYPIFWNPSEILSFFQVHKIFYGIFEIFLLIL